MPGEACRTSRVLRAARTEFQPFSLLTKAVAKSDLVMELWEHEARGPYKYFAGQSDPDAEYQVVVPSTGSSALVVREVVLVA